MKKEIEEYEDYLSKSREIISQFQEILEKNDCSSKTAISIACNLLVMTALKEGLSIQAMEATLAFLSDNYKIVGLSVNEEQENPEED
jgi:hypothetical protein